MLPTLCREKGNSLALITIKNMTNDDENHNEYDDELTVERFKRENPNWTEQEILEFFEL